MFIGNYTLLRQELRHMPFHSSNYIPRGFQANHQGSTCIFPFIGKQPFLFLLIWVIYPYQEWGLLFLPAGGQTQEVQSAQTVAIAYSSVGLLLRSLAKVYFLWGPEILNLQSAEFWEQEAQRLPLTHWDVKWDHFCSLHLLLDPHVLPIRGGARQSSLI